MQDGGPFFLARYPSGQRKIPCKDLHSRCFRGSNPLRVSPFSPAWVILYINPQRRPERQPRRHCSLPFSRPWLSPYAQRRPERQPRRHSARFAAVVYRIGAQRRPERQPRRHLRTWTRSRVATSALNEGRSVNPGDTGQPAHDHLLADSRSTKAGASTPATRSRSARGDQCRPDAQRRPERQPRRHSLAVSPASSSTDAQRRPERQPRRHSSRAAPRSGRSSLNEGRSVNPGDTPKSVDDG